MSEANYKEGKKEEKIKNRTEEVEEGETGSKCRERGRSLRITVGPNIRKYTKIL